MILNLNLNGPITMRTGYGVVVTNFLLNLDKQGVDVTAWPVQNNAECLPEHKEVVNKCINRQEAFDCNAPCLRIFHQFSMAESIGRGKRIGMPIFELDTFTRKEKTHLSSLDHIVVNSKWAKRVVEDNGIRVPTTVVPLGYDPTIFYPTTPSKRSSVVFLNIGKWSMNKGHDVLKTIFENAFSPADDVELWMCCHNHFLTPQEQQEWERYYMSGPMGHKVRIIPWQATQRDLASLIQQADVGVFPSRGEGWCFHADTNVITDNNVKNISKVVKGDKVINHLGQESVVKNVLCREYDGDLLSIKVVGSPLVKLTPEHSIYGYKNPYKSRKTFLKHVHSLKPEWDKASNFSRGDFLLVPRIVKEKDTLERKNIILRPNKEMMRLFGYYLAEGSCSKGAITFSFNTKEKEYHRDVQQLMENIFVKKVNYQHLSRNRTNMVFCSRSISEVFSSIFGRGARNKNIPFEFMFFDNQLVYELLVGLYRGDGTRKDKCFSLSTTSKKLAWQTKYLLIKLGIRATLQKAKNRLEYKVGCQGVDRKKLNFDDVEIVNGKYGGHATIMLDNYMLTPIREIKQEKYSGLVYNLSIDGEKTYCIDAFAVHNCEPALEMMGCGKPVINTNYSGISEFGQLYPIDITGIESAYDGKWFFNQGNWAKLDQAFCNNFSKKMASAYTSIKNFGKQNDVEEPLTIAQQYTWEKSTCKLMSVI